MRFTACRHHGHHQQSGRSPITLGNSSVLTGHCWHHNNGIGQLRQRLLPLLPFRRSQQAHALASQQFPLYQLFGLSIHFRLFSHY